MSASPATTFYVVLTVRDGKYTCDEFVSWLYETAEQAEEELQRLEAVAPRVRFSLREGRSFDREVRYVLPVIMADGTVIRPTTGRRRGGAA